MGSSRGSFLWRLFALYWTRKKGRKDLVCVDRPYATLPPFLQGTATPEPTFLKWLCQYLRD